MAFAQAIDVPGKPATENPDEWLFKPIETVVASHHVLMLEAIQRTMQRPHGRLMMFMPPGSGKSVYTSTVAPTWHMGRNAGSKIILASYGSDLAKRHGRRARQIVKQEGYSGIFGTGISALTSAADEWSLENGSEYLAGGLLSGITGNRADGILIDDPVKGRDEAESMVIRQKTWDAYQDDLLTRLKPGGWIILIMTRWHADDLAGRILPENYAGASGMLDCRDGNTWEVINLPAEAERADDPLGRKEGEMLWPEWFDAKHWANFRSNVRTWLSLFQQRPTAHGGGIIKIEWFQYWKALPAMEFRFITADTAQKTAEQNDYSVFQCWGRSTVGAAVLIDQIRGKWESPELLVQARAFWYKHQHEKVGNSALRCMYVEDKASGTGLIQTLRREGVPVIGVPRSKDKITRGLDAAPFAESGNVYLPQEAPWLADFIAEAASFPHGAHDDQLDPMFDAVENVQKVPAQKVTGFRPPQPMANPAAQSQRR